MQEFLESKETLLTRLKTDSERGLTPEQVAKNAESYGTNTLTKTKPESLAKRIWHSATEPMVIMLIIAGIIAVGVNVFRAVTGGESDFLECVGIFIAIALSVVITVVMEGRSAKAFEALNKINEDTMVKVLRDGNAIMLNQKDLVAGDILLVATGDKIPADGRLLESMELAADESALTGESVSAKKDFASVLSDEKTPVAERNNMLYSGTYITSGFGKMVITAVGNNTEFGNIAKELSGTDKTSTPLQEKLSRLSKIVAFFGVAAACIVFVAQLITFSAHEGLHLDEVMEAFLSSIVLIVAAVPEGFPTIVAVSLSLNIIKLSKQNALVKKIIASETIGCINVICSDKTGTLTENKMTVTSIWAQSADGDNKIIEPTKLNDSYLLQNFCVNSTANINAKDMTFVGNPTECALLSIANTVGYDYHAARSQVDILHVFPFSSEEKHMTSVIKKDNGALCYSKGSPERIMAMCNISKDDRNRIEEKIAEFQKQARRIIAFAHKELNAGIAYENNHENILETDMVFDGFAAISDPLRGDVYEAVQNCRTAGVDLKILTGDNIVTATAIANELHVLDEKHIAVEAKDIEPLSDEALIEMLPAISVIARSTPTIKMRVVKLLKGQGNVVAVTGDGINDAPALKNADVGIAMGITGTEVSKEASDVVLLDDSFSTIVNAIQWGRGVFENFKRFISFQLTVNVSSVVVVLTSVLLGLKTPFTALQLLWINIIMDGPPALTLGMEPIYDDLLKQKPTKRSENILSKKLMAKIGLTGLYISIVFLLQYLFNFLGAAEGQELTVLFAMFSFFQLFNSFNCRELNMVSIVRNFFKNKLMLLMLSITFILQIVIIQFAGAFFGTVALPLGMWLKIIGVSFSVIVVSEIVKLVVRMVARNKE